MDYRQTIDYLYNQLPMYQRIGKAAYKSDLKNTIALDKYFGLPHKFYKTIHIGGTNGKGSVAHSLASLFQEAGLRTGLYSSPHFLSFRERIKVNGKPIEKQFIINFVQKHKSFFERLKPSFFEITVAMAFEYFRVQKVDIAVIEVGMGGRLDSTNIITPELSIITNISYDHTQFLGKRLEDIAEEKAGIIKPGVPVVLGETKPNVNSVFIRKAEATESPIYFANLNFSVADFFLTSENKLSVNIFKGGRLYLKNLIFGLTGNYQKKNLPVIVQSYEVLKNQLDLKEEHLRNGLKKVIENTGIVGRWQQIRKSPQIILDAGHNYEAIEQVVSQLRNMSKNNLIIIFGMVKDKEKEKIIRLLPKDADYIFTKSSVPRSEDASVLKQIANKESLRSISTDNVSQAIDIALKKATSDDLIFIGGSSFVVADALLYFEGSSED